MIAQLLARQGIGARVEHAEALSMSRISGWDTKGVLLICLCYVGNPSSAQVRYAIRRIRRRTSDIPILLALLGSSPEAQNGGLLENAEFIERSLHEIVDKVLAVASNGSTQSEPPELALGTGTLGN
jgi:hypothetical protein